jgi:hypothetical protein
VEEARTRLCAGVLGPAHYLALVALAVLAARPAAAKAPPAVRFVYERDASAADCPDADIVRYAVRARLGFDPFHEPADITIRASVSRAGEELRAAILLADESRKEGERHLVSRRADCSELASAMELALSIAIDPLSVARDPPPAPPAPIVVVAPAPAPPLPPTPALAVHAAPPPAPPAPPKRVHASVGAAGSVGGSLAATVGVVAGVGLGTEAWSIDIEGRADLPTSREVAGGRVSASMLAGTLAPCLHRWLVGGCLLATVALLRGSGQDLVDPREETTSLVAFGARTMIEVPGGSWIAFRAHLDLLSPLVRTTLKVGGEPVWTSPPVSAALGVAAVARFK